MYRKVVVKQSASLNAEVRGKTCPRHVATAFAGKAASPPLSANYDMSGTKLSPSGLLRALGRPVARERGQRGRTDAQWAHCSTELEARHRHRRAHRLFKHSQGSLDCYIPLLGSSDAALCSRTRLQIALNLSPESLGKPQLTGSGLGVQDKDKWRASGR